MPRYLYLLRHAQSADKQTGQSDKERVLTPTGLKESLAVGNFLKEQSLNPDFIIASSATRAKTTAEKIADVLAFDATKIVLRDDLYETTVPYILSVLSDMETTLNKVLMVGHNPVLSYLLDQVTHEQNRSLLPAELAVIKFDSSWKEIARTSGELIERFHKTI